MTTSNNSDSLFNRSNRTKMLEFTGVVVESSTRIMPDGTELWGITWYDTESKSFRRTENVKVIPMFVKKGDVSIPNPGFSASAIRERFSWWDAIGVDGQPSDYEGYKAECTTIIKETKVGTSVRSKPVKKLGRWSTDEVNTLKQQLKAERQGRADSQTAAQPVQSTNLDLTPEEEAQLLAAYDGRSDEAAQTYAFRNLGTSLTNHIMTGVAAAHLLKTGKLTLTEEGTYAAVVVDDGAGD